MSLEKRDNSQDAQTILSVVALVVSVVALFGTILQVAQQYYASAAGYAECGESVMGLWHTSKRRKFRPYELRFEVQFETPVIFVCPVKNTKGPVKHAPINFISGTTQSLEETRTVIDQQRLELIRGDIRLSADDQKQSDEPASPAKRVHTADNELATWVTMLSELQAMEYESQYWEQKQYGKGPPCGKPQAKWDNRTLAVALQPKKRSWDTMPSAVKKPYATTAMCHLLEIAAMLGLHWKEFNRLTDRYRAEGNGYILTGTKVDDLGLMFTFQIYGKSIFHENRVIPVDGVKELCCGYISTIFRKASDAKRMELIDEEPQHLGILQVGSANDLAEAMVLIGCNTKTANYLRSDKTRHGHLFPVAFELVGMLSECLHIRNSCFRMLPNPTPYHWDKKFFSLRKLLQEFRKKVQDEAMDQSRQVRDLARLAEEVVDELRPGPQDFSIPLLDALHSAILKCDDFLTAHELQELVTMVLREHFQEILRMANEGAQDSTPTGTGTATGASHPSAAAGKRPPSFDDLISASPEERQEMFMEIYFTMVLPRVRLQAVEAFRRRKTTNYPPSRHGRDPAVSSTSSAVATPGETEGARPRLRGTQSNGSSDMLRPGLHAQASDSDGFGRHLRRPSVGDDIKTLVDQAHDIWCTLVFRMLCWLLLHDFHRKDVQISKSELLGSRLPVYIA